MKLNTKRKKYNKMVTIKKQIQNKDNTSKVNAFCGKGFQKILYKIILI